MNKRLIAIIAATVLVVAAIAAVATGGVTPKVSTGVELTVVPADATITIDGKTKTKAGLIGLSPGEHKLAIERTDFVSQTVTITVTAKQKVTKTVALKPQNQAALDYLSAHPSELVISDGIGSAEINEKGAQISANNPLIEQLPYRGATFDITAGPSVQKPGDVTAAGIYIGADDQASKTKALNWIKAQGYDPAAYEIIYTARQGR